MDHVYEELTLKEMRPGSYAEIGHPEGQKTEWHLLCWIFDLETTTKEQPYKLYRGNRIADDQIDTSGNWIADFLYLPEVGTMAALNNSGIPDWIDELPGDTPEDLIGYYYTNKEEWERRG